jgi:hypothetical protein
MYEVAKLPRKYAITLTNTYLNNIVESMTIPLISFSN